MTNYIYALLDPSTNEIRYIGKTNNPEHRMGQHLWDSKTHRKHCHNHRWINALMESGITPEMKIIEECGDNWQDRERFWIKYYRDIGVKLTNVTDGGEGIDIPNRNPGWYEKAVETRIKNGSFAKTEEEIEKIRQTNLRKSSEYCKNGHKRTEENTQYHVGKNGRSYRNCLECKKNRIPNTHIDKTSLTPIKREDRYDVQSLHGKENYRFLEQWYKDHGHPHAEKCNRGHDLSGDNLRILPREVNGNHYNERICRECVRIRNRKYKKEKRTKNAQRDSDS